MKLNSYILLLFIVFTSGDIFAQDDDFTRATTEGGDSVILYNDGTWEYEDTEQKAPEPARPINPNSFKKPESANDVLKGKEVAYELYYDSKKWQKLSKPLNEDAEYSMMYHDQNAYAIIIPAKISIPMENLRNLVITNARNAFKKYTILAEEERIVNNTKVIMLDIKAELNGMSFVYIYYLFSNENGSMELISFTTAELFDEYKKDMEEFLNGLTIAKTEPKK